MIEKTKGKVGPEAQGAAVTTPTARASTQVPGLSGGSFPEVLAKLGNQIDRGEVLMKRAVAGGHSGMDAGELIALQAGIYRYTEAVDLAAKLVDRASSGIKTTLQGSG